MYVRERSSWAAPVDAPLCCEKCRLGKRPVDVRESACPFSVRPEALFPHNAAWATDFGNVLDDYVQVYKRVCGLYGRGFVSVARTLFRIPEAPYSRPLLFPFIVCI